jgi:rhomboid family protein
VPAYVMLGLWILLQLASGVGSISRTEQTAGVAYMAHIGGFVAGLVLVKVFAAGRRRLPGVVRMA